MAVLRANMNTFFHALQLYKRIYEHALKINTQAVPRHLMPGQPSARSRSLNTSLLRTNRQICSEASPVLYSQNVFIISSPKPDLEWLDCIGDHNITQLRTLHLFTKPAYEMDSLGNEGDKACWHQLLRYLAPKAAGLRHMYLFLDADEEEDALSYHHGAGKDV
ncbi:MAG: hypothetical protein L6R38_003249 [Xanthoria sp. 2 TBL-2021]|nr:MAG: hypothetical protein L6R38_003249 [Xanthoria sp. 2 TBL-2021]